MSEDIVRTAACACGGVTAVCRGEPIRRSMCHCLDCQRRTGSVFSVQARFRTENVTLAGATTQFRRTGDSGGVGIMHFCPTCGSTVYWTYEGNTEVVSVAVGMFADKTFPSPLVSVYEDRMHPWVHVPADIEHLR